MITLEIQALSERRENLLIEIGRVVVASGFILQRQRLAEERNGVLLTMVVRGPARRQRALASAMEAQERIISFTISASEEGVPKPHFAASRPIVYQPAVRVSEPPVAPAPIAAVEDAPDAAESVTAAAMPPEPECRREPESDFFPAATLALLSSPSPVPAPAPAAPFVIPFVELIPLGPDASAVDRMLLKLMNDYPLIFPRLRALKHSVAEASRESSLLLAGQRTGAWIGERDYHLAKKFGLLDAIERVGVPALGALVEVDQQAEQLHIHNSPICTEGGDSGCVFFSGYLVGLLGPVVLTDSVSIFSVCCRSYGAGECILAISD